MKSIFVLTLVLLILDTEANFLTQLIPFWPKKEEKIFREMDVLDFETFVTETLVETIELRIVHNLASFTKLLEDRFKEMCELLIQNKVNAFMSRLNKATDDHELNLQEVLPEEYSYHFEAFKTKRFNSNQDLMID